MKWQTRFKVTRNSKRWEFWVEVEVLKQNSLKNVVRAVRPSRRRSLAAFKCSSLNVQVHLSLADLKWHLVSRQCTCGTAVKSLHVACVPSLCGEVEGVDYGKTQCDAVLQGPSRRSESHRCTLIEAFTSFRDGNSALSGQATTSFSR